MKANYHSHTRWCRHGSGELEDYFRAGIELGYQEMAITEHIPLPGDPDYYRMSQDEFLAYNREFDRLIDQYADRIKVIKGFEAEYYPQFQDSFRHYVEDYGYQVIVMGQHTSVDWDLDYFSCTGLDQFKQYVEEVLTGLSTGNFTYLAHPDLPANSYTKPLSDKHLDCFRDLFSFCQSQAIPVEINANGYQKGRGYPNKEIWTLAAQEFPDLVCLVNSDAHTIEHFKSPKVTELRDKALALGLNVQEFLEY